MQPLIILCLTYSCVTSLPENAQYLKNAIRDLKNINAHQTLRRADVNSPSLSPIEDRQVPTHSSNRRVSHDKMVPPLSITKSELKALYDSAVSKGETLKLGNDDSYIHAAVHEFDDSHSSSQSDDSKPHTYEDSPPNNHGPDYSASNSDSGYYYYYYPLKSFIDDPQSHSHNITISQTSNSTKPMKSYEPLFMAISGFIGMAVMFLFSVVMLPNVNNHTKPNIKKSIWKKDDDLDNFSKIALRAINGDQCAERFACEMSQTARAFGINNNRFFKLFRRLTPNLFRAPVSPATKYKYKEIQCTAIPCKNNNNKNNNRNNNSKKNTNSRNNKNKVKNKNHNQKKT